MRTYPSKRNVIHKSIKMKKELYIFVVSINQEIFELFFFGIGVKLMERVTVEYTILGRGERERVVMKGPFWITFELRSKEKKLAV